MRTIGRFLDLSGLTVLWDRIKELLGTKADAVSGKGLSTNDYSDAEKEKVSAPLTHLIFLDVSYHLRYNN